MNAWEGNSRVEKNGALFAVNMNHKAKKMNDMRVIEFIMTQVKDMRIREERTHVNLCSRFTTLTLNHHHHVSGGNLGSQVACLH